MSNPELIEFDDGLRLRVEQSGAGRPLLLVHGFPLDHTMWRDQLAALGGTYRCIAPDLRGFGGSNGELDTLSMEQLADDLARLLDALEVATPVVFCGLSMGGYVAFQFFRRHRDRLAGLILCDTRAAADTPEAAAGRRHTAARVLVEGNEELVGSLTPKLFSQATLDEQPDLVRGVSQLMRSARPRSIAGALRGMAERADSRELLPAIDVPTLVVCGEDDAIVPPREMRELAEAIPAAELAIIPRAGHMAPLEAPRPVNERLLQFAHQLPAVE